MSSVQELPKKLLIATGNRTKALSYYEEYPFEQIVTLDPEKDFDVEESLSPNCLDVAWGKTNVIVGKILEYWPEDDDWIVTANDIAAFYSKTVEGLRIPGKRKDLKKIVRDLRRLQTAREQKRLIRIIRMQTMEMYCNGKFYFMWELGTAAQIPVNNISTAGKITITGVFNPVDERIVSQSFGDGTAFHMSPRIPLAKIADKYAENLYMENNALERQQINQNLLYRLVVQGTIPFTSFLTLINSTQPTQEYSDYNEVTIPLPVGVKYERL